MESGPPHPSTTHTRKTSQSKPKPGHERCQHTWRMMQLGRPPQPTAPWRPLVFRVHCVVTQRWMKLRVPFAWFWYGDSEYGTPEVEAGTIHGSKLQPPEQVLAQAIERMATPGPRLTAGEPPPLAGPTLPERDLVPYQTPAHRRKTLEEQASSFDATQGYGR